MSDSILPDTPQRQCTKCDKWLPATTKYFEPSSTSEGGLRICCRSCNNAANRARYAQGPRPVDIVPDGYKRCTQCEQVLLISDFSQEQRNHRGIRGACKTCLNTQSKQYRQDLGEDLVKRKAQDYQKHKEKRQAHNKQYYQEHREEARIYHSWYGQEHKEERSRHASLYRQTERGKLNRLAAHRRRRALKRNAIGSFTPEQFQEQIKRQKYRCYYCGKRRTKAGTIWHPDHVVPLSRGGSNSIDNIVAACPACNLRKYNKLPHEWADGGRLL